MNPAVVTLIVAAGQMVAGMWQRAQAGTLSEADIIKLQVFSETSFAAAEEAWDQAKAAYTAQQAASAMTVTTAPVQAEPPLAVRSDPLEAELH